MALVQCCRRHDLGHWRVASAASWRCGCPRHVWAMDIRRGDRDRHAGSLLVWWRPRLRVLLRPHSVVNRCVRHLSSASNQRPASALITRCSSAQRSAMPVGRSARGRSGCVPDGLNNSPSVDHAPSLGVRPNVQTGFAPKVEETLGYCRKPHMGTGAFRARKAAHLRLTFVGPLPSVHSGMQTWYAGQVRIAISADTTRIVTTCLMWRQARWRSLCDYPSRQSIGQVQGWRPVRPSGDWKSSKAKLT